LPLALVHASAHYLFMPSRTALPRDLAAKPAAIAPLAWCAKQTSRLVALGADLDDAVDAVCEAQGDLLEEGRIAWFVFSSDLARHLTPVDAPCALDVPPPY